MNKPKKFVTIKEVKHAIYEGGVKNGEKIGEARGKKLKEEKIPIEIIIKTTGLTASEIENL